MRQTNVVSSPFHDRHRFRPRLEALEDRLAPTVSFASQATFAVTGGPDGIAVGDFTGSGKPDVVDANETSGSVSVLVNTTANGASAASFAAEQTFAAGSSPTDVQVGDINGDGRPDIVVSNQNGMISVLLNTTAAGSTAVSFAPPQSFAVGDNPSFFALADLNGDGRPDIAAGSSDSGSDQVGVLMNTTPLGATTVSFAAQQTFATPASAFNIAVGDINGDGRPDIVATYDSSATPIVMVLLNTTPNGATAASFAATQTFAVSSYSNGLALVDLNGSGRPDIALVNGGDVSILMNTTPAGATAASFTTEQTFAVGSQPQAVVVGDFNGDGKEDLAVTNYVGTISVLENTTALGATAASFAAQQTFANGHSANFLAAADFNADGRVDLISTNYNNATVSVYLNNLTTSMSSVTGPVLVGDFIGYGIQLYNSTLNTYVQLTPLDPSVLADNAAGSVVGNFPGYGIQLYRPGFNTFGIFSQLTPASATALGMDAMGDIVGNFPGYGLQLYRPASGWSQVTPFQATQVALDAYGNIVATFAGYGLQQYSLASNTWRVITPFVPTTFAVNAYDQIVASFTGYGVQRFTPWIGWQSLTSFTANSVAINSYGEVLASFPGYGPQYIFPGAGNWTAMGTSATGQFMALDRYGHGYGDFAGYGVNFYTPLTTWSVVGVKIDPSLLAVADWPFDLSSPF
jgi:hypothetical protein